MNFRLEFSTKCLWRYPTVENCGNKMLIILNSTRNEFWTILQQIDKQWPSLTHFNAKVFFRNHIASSKRNAFGKCEIVKKIVKKFLFFLKLST